MEGILTRMFAGLSIVVVGRRVVLDFLFHLFLGVGDGFIEAWIVHRGRYTSANFVVERIIREVSETLGRDGRGQNVFRTRSEMLSMVLRNVVIVFQFGGERNKWEAWTWLATRE